MNMTYFILGFISCLVIVPIIQTIIDLIINFLEIPKGYITLEVSKLNNKILDENNKQQKTSSCAIGFQVPSEEYDEDDEFEEDKVKMGFR